MTTLREAAQQALEALEWISDCYVGDDDAGECASCHERSYKPHAPDCKKNNAITALRSALAQPVPHGCHVDLDPGMKPDGCVLDENRPKNCIYALRLFREGKDKTACEYWQPIEVTR